MSAAPHNPLSSYAFINFPVELPPPSPRSASSSSTMSSMQSGQGWPGHLLQTSAHGLILSSPPSSGSSQGSPSFYTHLLPGITKVDDMIPEPGIARRKDRLDKKSHAKRQPLGHVPRPRNAFILFRCDFVAQKMISAEIENNHRNISRIAGVVWKQMDDVQREPWTTMAVAEKNNHKAQHPNYRYNPLASSETASTSATKRKSKSKASQSQSQPSSPQKVESSDGGSPNMLLLTEESHIQTLRIPYRRSFSAPPDAGILDAGMFISQPSLLPLSRSYFSSDYVVPASDTVVSYALAQPAFATEALGCDANATSALAVTSDDAYGAYDTVASGLELQDGRVDDFEMTRRYNNGMQAFLFEHNAPEGDKKLAFDDHFAVSYEHAAEEYIDPRVFASGYEYDNPIGIGEVASELYPSGAYTCNGHSTLGGGYHGGGFLPEIGATPGLATDFSGGHPAYDAGSQERVEYRREDQLEFSSSSYACSYGVPSNWSLEL